jgi:predicted SAM-dependent methyltransferase
MTREEKLLQLVDREGIGLEIGPSYSPVAPKSAGWKVDVLDYLDAEGLRKKYAAWGVACDKIEDVDYVISDKSLLETIGKSEHYDFIIASHVIEHMFDLVRFLRDCQALLKPKGLLCIAAPDKRFCFDVFKPVTSTGMILQAYIEKRKRHTAGAVFDNFANHAMRGGNIVWFDRELGDVQLPHTVAEAKTYMDQYIRSGAFEDIHAWFFTPSSFRLLIQDLNEIGLIQMGMVTFHETFGFEFFATFRKLEAAPKTDRIELLLRIDAELAGKPSPI